MTPPKSLIALSLHKAGSSIFDRIVQDVAQARGYTLDLIASEVSDSPLPEKDIFINAQARMRDDGVYYGVARGPYVRRMPRILDLRALVQVRDPRDCITSAFFSFSQSHRPPRNPAKLAEFHRRRETVRQTDIDAYALRQTGQYRERLEVLARIIDAHGDIRLLKYEEMVLETERWLARIAAFLDQPVTPELRAQLGDKLDFNVATEDVGSHKRQVMPGDHRRKLRPETIAAMNADLAEMLARFGYPA